MSAGGWSHANPEPFSDVARLESTQRTAALLSRWAYRRRYSRPMPFRYRLSYPDGEDAGEFATAVPDWRAGDTFRTGHGHHLRIGSIVPLDLIGELVDRPIYAAWEVEHVH
jgi:hypothetical protein